MSGQGGADVDEERRPNPVDPTEQECLLFGVGTGPRSLLRLVVIIRGPQTCVAEIGSFLQAKLTHHLYLLESPVGAARFFA